jgi:hypothetical protein
VKAENRILLVAQVAGTLGTLVAVWVAVVAIRAANAHARAAAQAALHERSIDFQLGVLRDLAEVNLRPDGTDLAIGQLKLLASMLPIDSVPIARAVAGLATTPEAGLLKDETSDQLKAIEPQDWSSYPVWGVLRQRIQDELVAAAGTLVSERD